MVGLLIALLALAGALRAVHDTGTHAPAKLAKWGPYWDALESWKLKYRNYDVTKGPRFWGSTTVFVALTDGWHLTNLLSWGCADAALLLAAWPAYRWGAVAAVGARRLVFQPLYSWLRK
ncbi:MAG: hypothetical protein ACRYFR_04980 [Janthinobacterium lividum]